MIRLIVLLGAGIFLTLLIAGQDHGQLRQGLTAIAALPSTEGTAPRDSAEVTSPAPVTERVLSLSPSSR